MARESGQRFASPQPLKPQSCCTSGCSHPVSFCGPFPEGRWAVHWANDPNEQPTEVDCLTLLSGLVDPGLLFGVKGVAFAPKRRRLCSQQHSVNGWVQLDDLVLLHQCGQIGAEQFHDVLVP